MSKESKSLQQNNLFFGNSVFVNIILFQCYLIHWIHVIENSICCKNSGPLSHSYIIFPLVVLPSELYLKGLFRGDVSLSTYEILSKKAPNNTAQRIEAASAT